MLFFGIRFLPGILVMFGFYHSVSLGRALPRHVKSWCMFKLFFPSGVCRLLLLDNERQLAAFLFPIWGAVLPGHGFGQSLIFPVE